MNLIEIQTKIMTKVHNLKEHENFSSLSEEDIIMFKSIKFDNLSDMEFGDLFTLESYITKTKSEIQMVSVYDLISEISSFVENRLLDESSDKERSRLTELTKFMNELNEELRDWELRRIKEDASLPKPKEVDLEKVVDSLESVVDRLIVQYGEAKKESSLEEQERHPESRVTPKDEDRDVGEQPKQGGESKRKMPEIDSEGDGDLKEGAVKREVEKTIDDVVKKQKLSADGDTDKLNDLVFSATFGTKVKVPPKLKKAFDEIISILKKKKLMEDLGDQPTEGDKEKAGKEKKMPSVNTITGKINEAFEKFEKCKSEEEEKKK